MRTYGVVCRAQGGAVLTELVCSFGHVPFGNGMNGGHDVEQHAHDFLWQLQGDTAFNGHFKYAVVEKSLPC